MRDDVTGLLTRPATMRREEIVTGLSRPAMMRWGTNLAEAQKRRIGPSAWEMRVVSSPAWKYDHWSGSDEDDEEGMWVDGKTS